ncbi:MAG: N-formylglutamate amidohydrolase [Lachnospiraceae bacterium]|nr:N-formylglutamate amidohydrolase [Lachnospiraceae bacterium]
MKNDFRERGILRVRVVTEEDHVHLYSLLEDLGYPEVLEWYGGRFYPNATNVYEVNIFRKEARSVPSVTACAAMASSGVRFYSVGEFDRLAKQGFKIVPRFPVFHIPHDGWRFPEELMASVCIPKEQFFSFHEKMRDRDLNKIVPRPYHTGSNVARFEVSRLLCDVERFAGPEEVMEQYGMGFCYDQAYDGTVIKNVTDDLKEKTLKYYREHHEEVDRMCSGHPRVVLFDLHSYTDELVPVEFMKAGQRTPDVCIGTDERYTPPALTKAVRDCFEQAGFKADLNYPYSGCFVPDTVMRGESSCDCISVMIELNRRIYCDEKGESVPEKLERIQEIMQRILDTVPWD